MYERMHASAGCASNALGKSGYGNGIGQVGAQRG